MKESLSSLFDNFKVLVDVTVWTIAIGNCPIQILNIESHIMNDVLIHFIDVLKSLKTNVAAFLCQTG
jgi:hypothetical protein